MRNIVRAILVVTCVVACGQAFGAEKTAKIVDETVVFALGEDVNRGENAGIGSMRLSPDGTKLLFIRSVKDGDGRRSYPLILRDIKAGKDRELKIPCYAIDDIAVFMLSGNVFDKAGKRVALGVGIDANKNGRHDFMGDAPEKMQAVLYDLATDEMTKVGETADVALASFDRTGEGLVMIVADKKAESGKMLVTPVAKIKLRQFSLWGLPRGLCPTADVMALLIPPSAAEREAGQRPKAKMVLFDLGEDKVLASVPLRESNTSLDDHCPQWTGDGRYLYYVGVDREPTDKGGTRRKYESRIWDRAKGEAVSEVPGLVPIGPGPTAGTMLLAPYASAAGDKPVVHDAKADTMWTVDGPAIRVITSEGKYVVYTRKGDEGKETVYRGRIVLPAK